MKKLLFLFCFQFSFIASNSQSIDNIWLLGYAQLSSTNTTIGNFQFDFVPQQNTSIYLNPRNIRMDITIANISDSVGNFLFACNGYKIINRNNQIMQNGDSLTPGILFDQFYSWSGVVSQGAIIIPIAGSNRYFLFHSSPTTINSDKLYYSLIDMDLQGGNGSVVEKNIALINDNLAYGMLTACKHGNGRDWWVIIPKWNSNKYYRLLVGPNGIESNELITYGPRPSARDWTGQISISSDGSKYARYDVDSGLVVMDFDRCSGTFSNVFRTLVDTGAIVGGVEFSPNGKVLYVSAPEYLYQYNLDTTDIAASKRLLGVYDGFTNPPNSPFASTFFQMKVAPDGKIYMSCTNGIDYIHVINNPNALGASCGFVQHGIQLPYYNSSGLPNHPNYHLGPLTGSICDSLNITVSNNIEQEGNAKFWLNPNPANNYFFLNYQLPQGKQYYLKVYNVQGSLMLQKEIFAQFGYQQIETLNWQTGLYFCKIEDKNGQLIKNLKLGVVR